MNLVAARTSPPERHDTRPVSARRFIGELPIEGRSLIRDVPEGQMTIAQHLQCWVKSEVRLFSPGGTADHGSVSRLSSVPTGRCVARRSSLSQHWKCWAILAW